MINALPGNSFVNTNIGNNRRGILFSMWPEPKKSRRYRESVARQRIGKQAYTTTRDGVFREVRSKELS
jgi:hypothetical protein